MFICTTLIHDHLVDTSEIIYLPNEDQYGSNQFNERTKWRHWQNFNCQKYLFLSGVFHFKEKRDAEISQKGWKLLMKSFPKYLRKVLPFL